MARKLRVYFNAALAPDRAALHAAIKGSGIRLTLDDAYAPFDTTGYLPCTLEGEDAGVDLRFDRDGDWPDTARALAAERGDRQAVAMLAWGGDPREQISAWLLAAALAQTAQGLILDAQRGQLVAADALVKQAKALAADSF